MKKGFVLGLVLLSLILIPFVSADFELNVEKKYKASVVIGELKNPALIELVITNNGEGDTAEIYTLVGVSMTPKGTFYIPNGVSKVEARAYLSEEYLDRVGVYSFEYQIKGVNKGIFKDKINIRVVSLKDAFSVETAKFYPDDSTINLTIRNNINAHLEKVDMHFSSAFFELNNKLDFEPLEVNSFSIPVDKTKISKLSAGPYIIDAEVKIEDVSTKYEGTVNYLEKEDVKTDKDSSGFLIRKVTVIKTNSGNVPASATIEVSKNIISRFFTSYSISPLNADRGGLFVNYVWKKELAPGESYSISVTTNYTYILILLVLIGLIVSLVWYYSATALKLQKSVSFVRTRGGEFALKVKLRIKARKPVSNIQIFDRLPMMVKLYNKFGRSPDKIDEKTRQLIWNIPYLNKGEERVYSYVVYSKLRAVGRLELPVARASFVRDGQKKVVTSNRAYFASETMSDFQ